jgi:UTP--glucose-1-phosphate uridylyltransferase
MEKKSSILSVEKIKPEDTKRYGIVSGNEIEEGIMLVDDLVEKPELDVAPSLLGIQGRYVFTPQLFDYLKKARIGFGGEIQLTDAMKSLSKVQKMYSWTFKGKRYDIGTMKDWFQSHLELSFKSEYSSVLEEVLKKL